MIDGREVVVQTHGRLVVADDLDGVGELDLALVELADAGRLDGVRDIAGLDRTEQAALAARLDGQLDLGRLELGLEVLGLLDVCSSRAARAALICSTCFSPPRLHAIAKPCGTR